MKKCLICISLAFSVFFSFGQEIENSVDTTHSIVMSLDNHYQQFSTGAQISLLGMAVTYVGMLSETPELAYIGGGVSIVGSVIMFASHRF